MVVIRRTTNQESVSYMQVKSHSTASSSRAPKSSSTARKSTTSNKTSTSHSTARQSKTTTGANKTQPTKSSTVAPTGKTAQTRTTEKVNLSKESREKDANIGHLASALHQNFSNSSTPPVVDPQSNNEPLKGIHAAQQTKSFKDASAAAERNEANRPHRQTTNQTRSQIKGFAKDLRDQGHTLEKTHGQRLNAESVKKRGATPTEAGPDGKTRVKSGEYAPPSDPKAKAYKIDVGKDGLKSDRVFTVGKGADAKAIAEKGGGFSAPKGSLDGLTRKEIQEKLALKEKPTHIQDVTTPGGGKKNLSVVGDQPGLSKQGGKGLQFHHSRDSGSKFGDFKRLNDLEVHTQRFARNLERVSKVGKVFKPIGIVTDALDLKNSFQKDGNTVGKETIKTAAGITGGWGGAVAGAEVGALTGAALGTVVPVVGNVVGGVVGGFIGGIAGAYGGSTLGKWLFS